MYPSSLPQFSTFLALRDWTPFTLGLDGWLVGVFTRRGSVTLGGRFTGSQPLVSGMYREISLDGQHEYRANLLSLVNTCQNVKKWENTRAAEGRTMISPSAMGKRRNVEEKVGGMRKARGR